MSITKLLISNNARSSAITFVVQAARYVTERRLNTGVANIVLCYWDSHLSTSYSCQGFLPPIDQHCPYDHGCQLRVASSWLGVRLIWIR